MKPLNLITLLLFIAGAAWALTRSDGTVRSIQNSYFAIISPFLKGGSGIEKKAFAFIDEVEHSKAWVFQGNEMFSPFLVYCTQQKLFFS